MSASSGASTISNRTIPPGSTRLRTQRSSADGPSSAACAVRNPRQRRSSCAPVACSAISSNRASFSAVATRVSARTLAYDSLPTRRASSMAGNLPSARATRTFSRAVAASNPTRHASQCAQETAPCSPQPHCSSNCRIQVSNRCVAASRCADNEAISRPNSSTENMGKTIRVFSGGGKGNRRDSVMSPGLSAH